MLFWLAIAVGVIFAYIGIRIGFYMVWQSLFNVLVAIYLSVMITPRLVGLIPELSNSGYNTAACVIGLMVVIFLVLQTVTACFLTGISDVRFPGIFESVGTGALGFVLGYVIASFVLFTIYMMPVSRIPAVEENVFKWDEKIRPASVRATEKACGFVGDVSLQYHDTTVQDVCDWLLKSPYVKKEDEFNNSRWSDVDLIDGPEAD